MAARERLGPVEQQNGVTLPVGEKPAQSSMSTDRYVPDTFPMRFAGSQFKGTKAEARAEKEEKKQGIADKEDRNKTAARRRDGWMCRFPRCVCHVKRLHPEVAHTHSKGAGGDHGTRSHHSLLICLCPLRHRESRVSFHYETMKAEPLTEKGMDGPVRWLVDITAITVPQSCRQAGDEDWQVVATESRVRVLEPLTKQQAGWLEAIAGLTA
jgi:hypothetical protein